MKMFFEEEEKSVELEFFFFFKIFFLQINSKDAFFYLKMVSSFFSSFSAVNRCLKILQKPNRFSFMYKRQFSTS